MEKGEQRLHRIMIVDDDPMVRSSVKAVLESAGLGVVVADGGTACLEEMAKGFRGVILMDIDMPGMDGWDTIKELVERGQIEGNIVAMLTGMDKPGDKMDGLQEYVLDYITKPFDTEDLTETVQSYLAHLE